MKVSYAKLFLLMISAVLVGGLSGCGMTKMSANKILPGRWELDVAASRKFDFCGESKRNAAFDELEAEIQRTIITMGRDGSLEVYTHSVSDKRVYYNGKWEVITLSPSEAELSEWKEVPALSKQAKKGKFLAINLALEEMDDSAILIQLAKNEFVIAEPCPRVFIRK